MIAAVAVALVAGGAVVAGAWWRDVATVAQAPATEAAPAGAPAAPAATTSVAPPTSRPPGALLTAQAVADRSVAESLVGSWAPQIGSKAVGTRADGLIYDQEAIWEQYLATRARFSSVVLIRSDDYTSFRRDGYWVILVAESYATAAGANGWCESAGLPVDDCFAKRLSHTEGPQGNTVSR